MKTETKNEIKLIVKAITIATVCIFGMGFASLVYIPWAYEAYDGGAINVQVYYIIWATPMIGIVFIVIGVYFYVTREPNRQTEEETKDDTNG